MKPAEEKVSVHLSHLLFRDPLVPVVTNVDAQIVTWPSRLRRALQQQVSAPVRWLESMQVLLGAGVGTFVEVGPGKVLSGLIRQTNRDAKCLNVEDAASLEATRAALAGQG
jgi:[acyl-carrier-protein] S-malonyltransferase